MPHLPTGTVTFLFTDIEGSTKLWERYPGEMKTALVRHNALLQSAVETNDGYVFKTVGDAFCSAFNTAPDALSAVIDAQNALFAEVWGETGPLRVRMALHTGAAEERGGDYFGQTLNRVARLLSAGYGGQTLLSQPTYDLVRDALPENTDLRDLGDHRLKDLVRPEHVFQLVAPDLPTNFPPLKTLDTRPNNLPAQPTPLIGREKELDIAHELLLSQDIRLLTFTGFGGAGKTRLGLQVAADLIDEFEDGVYFVDLSHINDPELVFSTIAQTLGVNEAEGRPLNEVLKESLRDKQMLLMLDNFEQIMEAVPQGIELMRDCHRLKLLVTSREAIHVRGERVFPVPPLSLPELGGKRQSIKRLRQFESVRLFIERALGVKPEFEVTNENAPAIAEICVRLDGLPLAIELASARVKLFSPEAILSRFENRLKLLTGGARDLPPRQRTLRATIDWSYDLLDVGEQTLFRRLAVFVGGCTLEATEAVGDREGDLEVEVLDGVSSLVDKNLLVQKEVGGEPRFTMFETIGEYGLDRLEGSGELEATRRAHADYYLGLAEEAEPELQGPEQGAWLDRLESEHDNLRAALEGFELRKEVEKELRLGGALWQFWSVRGHLNEGRERLEEALKHSKNISGSVRAKALLGAGNLLRDQGDYEQALNLLEESLKLFQNLGNQSGIASFYHDIGWTYYRLNRLKQARECFNISLKIGRELGDKFLLAWTGLRLGPIDWREGQIEEARMHFEESRRIFSELGERRLVARAVGNLGLIYHQLGDLDKALSHFRQTMEIQKELGDVDGLSIAYNNLGHLYHQLRDYNQAVHYYEQLKQLAQATGNKRMLGTAYSGLAEACLALENTDRALEVALEAQKVAQEVESDGELGVSYRVLGEVHLSLGQVDKAKSCFEQSIPLLEEATEKEELAKAQRGYELALSHLSRDS